MANKTSIEWCDLTWNPVHGCSIVSTECRNCYAMTLSLRYGQTTKPWTPANAAENVLLKPHKLRDPLRDTKDWRGLGDAARAAGKTDGMLVFVNSMSDLFHEQVPYGFIAQCFQTMAQATRHTFQILTKRPERMVEVMADLYASGLNYGEPLPNVWLGTSIGLRHFIGRADALRATPAAVRFISAEPLLGPLDGLSLDGIDWLIVGGESGSGHRPMDADWVRDLRDQCQCGLCGFERSEDCDFCSTRLYRPPAFFFKQWGGARPGGEALLNDREWREFPRC